MRAVRIDAQARRLFEIELPTEEEAELTALQAAVSDYTELADRLPNGDVILVDEEGLLKNYGIGFAVIRGCNVRSYVGNGIVIGPAGPERETTPAQTPPPVPTSTRPARSWPNPSSATARAVCARGTARPLSCFASSRPTRAPTSAT